MVKIVLALILMISTLGQAQMTLIPDPNFEQRLIDMGYDNAPIDGVVPTANINTITSLFVPLSNISDLTGIEDFAALETLDTSSNPISILDLGSNTAMRTIFTGQNELTSLNVSNCTALEVLVCHGTLLGSLDLSNNPNLRLLNCVNSQLTSLDLSNNTQLTNLVANDNLFTSLDLSQNTALEGLVCQNTGLISLILSSGNNTTLENVDVRFNSSLACIEVDDENEANASNGVYGNWMKDAMATYAQDCAATLSTDTLLPEDLEINIYPNPSKGQFIVRCNDNLKLKALQLLDVNGKEISMINIHNTHFYPVSVNLERGIYFLKVKTNNTITTKKVIINY
ncbi:T9SS type A sorting domain-containing protein [uncultured Psychroserpens sp.]|uniref:T9SS type A sorting domain-containing protein n=1 Tax=uncultured Psychroserpens sp. TaxID=255436 RepID=UPI00260A79F6|nr:T9SS type A sorting domain-containing protein [uncultured Psychroserpens sp.]